MNEYIRIKENKIKELDELSKLSTIRLLSYYKARRMDRIKLISGNTCDCCGEAYWDLYKKSDYIEEIGYLEKNRQTFE
jgi:hypothetical protein